MLISVREDNQVNNDNLMVVFNCGVVCFVGASCGLGTGYNPLIQTSMHMAICGLDLTPTTVRAWRYV